MYERILINTLITIILVFLLEIVLVDLFPQIHQFVGEIPTYTGVKNAKQQINNTLNSIESTTRQIEELVKLAESSQTITIQKKYTKDDVDWQLNIPQLLIYLDKGAEECNVDIDIHYNLANMYNQPGEYANAINETAPGATETTETAETAEAIILTHHEKSNGSSYPMRLTYDKIHKCSRIVSIADIYDAIIGITLILFKVRKRKEGMPYGPSIALGVLMTYLIGPELLNLYLATLM